MNIVVFASKKHIIDPRQWGQSWLYAFPQLPTGDLWYPSPSGRYFRSRETPDMSLIYQEHSDNGGPQFDTKEIAPPADSHTNANFGLILGCYRPSDSDYV